MEGVNIIGAVDTITKAYIRENEVFADAFNYFIYQGRQVINPENLKELDTTEIILPMGAVEKNTEKPLNAVQKYRDVLKSATIMVDNRSAYILLGVENQINVHYAMPVRNMIYDALQYGQQIADISAVHRREKKNSKEHSKSEFLSGFYKEDKLLPVITEVVNMCQVIEEMIKDGKNEGRLEVLIGLVRDGLLNITEAAKRADMTVDEFQSKMK